MFYLRSSDLSPRSQLTGELAAILGAAYESFLKTRIERRAGRRGKVHAWTAKSIVEIVREMIADAGGHDADTLWHVVVAELDHDWGEIEDDVLAHHGFVVVEHEWPAFVEWVGQVRDSWWLRS